MWFFWLVLGVVLGAAAVWYWRDQKEGERVADVQGSWEAKYRHALEDVKRADAAHEETKERLRAAENRVAELEAEKARLEAELAERERAQEAARTAAAAPSEAARAGAEGAAAPRRGDARLKQIDAKLAQLPAGSSARKALLAERRKLLAERGGGAAAAGGEGDDLKRIKGIGPAIAAKLEAMGITRIAQIAALSAEDIARIESELGFKGRIARERWVEQARELMESGRSAAAG